MMALRVAVICLGLLPFVAGAQTHALPPVLRAHVDAERFAVVTSIRGLPLGVRDELQAMFGGSLDIADPGSPLEPGSSTTATPMRRLVAAGCARDHHCLVYYQLRGASPGWRVTLFHWTPESTRFEWGAVAPGGLETIDAVRTAISSGRLRAAATW
jgi:hypothetical protein